MRTYRINGLRECWILGSPRGGYRWWTIAVWLSGDGDGVVPQGSIKVGPVSINLWKPWCPAGLPTRWTLDVAVLNGEPQRVWRPRG